jgi:choline dehydrogenase-like flavoprotein
MSFDAIVIGSGMSGGFAAKELCERGLKVLLLERGRDMDPKKDSTDHLMPWELPLNNRVPEEEVARDYAVQSQCYAFTAATKQFWAKDSEQPYSTPDDKPFSWIRGNHLGGRSVMWGRQSYRLSQMDFEANAKDGHGCDWPIRYADLAPWYDHVERFIGVAGSKEGLPQLPDGEFLPPFELNDAEKLLKAKVEASFPGRKVISGRAANLSVAQPQHTELGRSSCQNRSICERACRFGAYHSSLNSSLPAARRTGNLTVVTDAIVQSLVHDPKTGRVSAVRVIDAKTNEGRTYEARIVFLNASTIGSAQILLNSASAAHPRGLANGSDQVGRNLMDHLYGMLTVARFPGPADSHYVGRRPTGLYIPRFRNVSEQAQGYVRGYGYQGGVSRAPWKSLALQPGLVGADLKQAAGTLGPWMATLVGFGEILPYAHNRMTLHATRKDKWGIPIPHIEFTMGANELAMKQQIQDDARAMLEAAGAQVVMQTDSLAPPGLGIHEMGSARMGRDPATSVLNQYNQAHEVSNLFITDGSAMASSGCQNPSLTYMAMSARAAHHAVEFMKAGKL